MFSAASFAPKRNILRPRPQVTLPPLSRLRLLPLFNSRPLDLINVRYRSCQHERRLALHEVALRNGASSVLQWPLWPLVRSCPCYHRPMPAAHCFPPPWMIEEHNDACFIVRDNNGQALGYFYFEEEFGRRSADVRF